MFKHLAKSSRLIIIYVLTVLVSGSILTWLSLNNVSNFRELTEKRILEEEEQIAEKYSKAFDFILDSLTVVLNREIIRIDTVNVDRFKIDYPFLQNCLLLNQNGDYLSPHYIKTQFKYQQNSSSSVFQETLKKAQLEEFAINNLELSKNSYTKALKYSQTKKDSAVVFNALARVLTKTGKSNEAIKTYNRIISYYGSVLNDIGFSYANIAMDQILNIDGTTDEEIENAIKKYLFKIINNDIVISDNTETILKRIDDFINKSTKDYNNLKSSLMDIIYLFNNLKRFNPIIQKMIEEEKNETNTVVNEFNILIPSDSITSFMLIRSFKDRYFAFVINLDKLDKLVIQKGITNNAKFTYVTTLVNKGFKINTPDPFTLVSNFSPIFKDKWIKIAVKNPEVVEDFVDKRKLVTISGLILLLGAMIIGLYTLYKDITREREVEKMRTDFVSNVTHELKTPLTAINMLAESILLNRATSEKQIKKYANVIVKESEKLKRSINNILEFSKNENKKLNYNFKDISLVSMIDAVLDEMNYWLELNKFQVEFDHEYDIIVKADEESLKLVLSNLVSNAIKYSDDKKTLSIKIYKTLIKAFIEIQDSGIGIPKEKQKYVFDKFYRIKGGKNSYISGTGLGLKVSKDIVEAHGGEIYLDSELNKGTKFTIELKC